MARRSPACDTPRAVVVVTGRCSQDGGTFGIRFEGVRRKSWLATWAFPIRPGGAAREGYGQSIAGSFEFAEKFPGCPQCGRTSFVKCRCGQLSCWDGTTRRVTCPSCGRRAGIGGAIDGLGAVGDA